MPYKVCDCGAECGPRTKVCECGRKFVSKILPRERKAKSVDVDWRTLEKGDKIQVVQGYGSYIKIGENKHFIGCPYGRYYVLSIEKDGFFVSDGSARYYVYMGETKESLVGIKEAHKIKLVKKHDC